MLHSLLLQSGEPITFYWRFVGIGEEQCFHDDVEIPNCKSGLVVQAKDVSHDTKEHKFRVVFTDVCGNSKDAEYTYTQEGVKTVSKVGPSSAADTVASEKGFYWAVSRNLMLRYAISNIT